MVKEVDIQRAIMDYLETLKRAGKLTYWRSGNYCAPNRRFNGYRGMSDLSVLLHPWGVFCGIECKTGKNRQSKDQRAFESDITNQGAIYILAYELDDVIGAFKDLGVI